MQADASPASAPRNSARPPFRTVSGIRQRIVPDALYDPEVSVSIDPDRAGPSTISNDEIVKGLNDLLQLDHDAIGAYRIAIDRLEDRDHAMQIAGYLKDHERHVQELTEVIIDLGGTPVNEPHATGPFREALQRLAAAGGDRSLLLAWRVNELQVRSKYDRYASKAVFWPDRVKALLDRNALDEDRHYRWVVGVLQAMGVNPGDGAEEGIVNRLRENLNRLDHARHTAGETFDRARFRAADGLAAAAVRLEEVAARQEMNGGAGNRTAGAAHLVAEGLDVTADFLRDPEADMLYDDVEDHVRRNPLRSVLMAAAIGFVVGRILR